MKFDRSGQTADRGHLSRRDFMKFSGALTGLCCTRLLLDRNGPAGAMAQSRPRVVSVRDSRATNWDYVTGYHWEYIDQQVVNAMVARGVMDLAGIPDLPSAWMHLVPYQPGEAVVIKINCNNHGNCSISNEQMIDAYPEIVNAVIDGLKTIGVPSHKIWITDPSRCVPNRFVNKISDPGVLFYSSWSWCKCNANFRLTDYVQPTSPHASPTTHPLDDVVRPAQVFVDAQHLINIPQLKGHGSGWMTLGLKNHYGSVMFKNYSTPNTQHAERSRLHTYIVPSTNPDLQKSTLADISNNPHIRDKTRLIIGDGLFGNPLVNYQSVTRWQIFGNDDPNIIFFGTDPIAADSVMLDYIREEQRRLGISQVNHSCLHHGAAIGLGIHEHWDNFESKRYAAIDYLARNLESVGRAEIDRKASDLKNGTATDADLRQLIDSYMQ